MLLAALMADETKSFDQGFKASGKIDGPLHGGFERRTGDV